MAKSLLLHKKLSMSDLSDSVLLSGRVVLPRVQMELNVDKIVKFGCPETDAHGHDAPSILNCSSAAFTLEVIDDSGRRWTVVLKQWTAHSGPQPRPIFVLERTAECMRAHRASPGHFLQLWFNPAEEGQTLRLSVLTSQQANASGSTVAGVQEAAAAAAAAAAATAQRSSLYQAPLGATDGMLGNCTRSPGCTKLSGHSGFCTGRQAFRASLAAAHAHCQGAHGAPLEKVAAIPAWVSVRSGSARGDLELDSLQVTPLDHRGRARLCGPVSLAEFERMGASGSADSSPILVEPEGQELQLWLTQFEAVPGYALYDGGYSGFDESVGDIETDAEVGELLVFMSMTKPVRAAAAANAGGMRRGRKRGRPAEHTAAAVAPAGRAAVINEEPGESVPVKPRLEAPDPTSMAQLYAGLAQEAVEAEARQSADSKTHNALERLNYLTERSKKAKELAMATAMHLASVFQN